MSKNYINKIEINSNAIGNGKIAIEDSILVKDIPATYGSKMLENFVPLFDAEVAHRLKKNNYSISGKAIVGEFGLDFLGESSYFNSTLNNSNVIVSSASQLIKNDNIDAVIGVDVNGGPRRGAALGGMKCLKPTYGTVSRYGVIPCACSGEQVTVTASTIEKIMEITSVIAGHDEKDGTSVPTKKYEFSADKKVSEMKIGVIKELLDCGSDEVKLTINNYCTKLKELGATVEEISLPETQMAKIAWFILSSAEIFNNLSKFDGVKYGHRSENYKDISELYKNSRSEAFGPLAKFIILYGSDVLSTQKYDNCYDKAMKMRRVIQEKVFEVFKNYDLLVMPITSKSSYTAEDIKDIKLAYNESIFTSLANLIGTPSLVSESVQLMSNLFDENSLFAVASSVERLVQK